MNTRAVRDFQKKYGRWFIVEPDGTIEQVRAVCRRCLCYMKAYANVFGSLERSVLVIRHLSDCSVKLEVACEQAKVKNDRRRLHDLAHPEDGLNAVATVRAR